MFGDARGQKFFIERNVEGICHIKKVQKFCDSIILAHQQGAFGGRDALWDLMRDIALNLHRSKTDQLYSKTTKLICQALYQHGGRQVVDCLVDNMLGPSFSTLQRDKKGMVVFCVGFYEDQFHFIPSVYQKLKTRHDIVHELPCMLAKDETYVKRIVRWLQKRDSLIGFGGKKEDHVCMVGLEIKCDDRPRGFQKSLKHLMIM